MRLRPEGESVVTTDPDSIPQHVVDAAINAANDAVHEERSAREAWACCIAVALDALMGDEPVTVDCGCGVKACCARYLVRPVDVLGEVLENQSTKEKTHEP